MADPASLQTAEQPVAVAPSPGVAKELIASVTLTQNFNNAISVVRSCYDVRRLILLVDYAAHASATDATVDILVMFSNDQAAPAIGDDSWYAAPVYDTSPTDADIAGAVTLPTNADFSRGPNFRVLKAGGLILQTMPASSSEEVRQRFTVDVSDARWFYAAAIQQGDTTNFGTLQVDYALSL